MRRTAMLLWIFSLTVLSAQADELVGEHIIACGDQAGWPPFHYDVNGHIRGYDVDVLDRILTPAGIDYSITTVPWARCLQAAKMGAIHLILSASSNPERQRNYALADSHYHLRPSYVYSLERHPDGLNIKTSEDLLQFRLCGLRGYNYMGYGIDNRSVHRNSNSYAEVSQKTLDGECDLFLARYEILSGFSLNRQPDLAPGLRAEILPGNNEEPFHMMVSKAYPHHEDLVDLLNEGINRLRDQGTLERLLDQYLSP